MKYTLNPLYKEQYKDFLLNIEKYFKQNKNSIHKARNELKIISNKDNNFVVKSFKIPNIINQYIYSYFRDSKAKKSYENSLSIQNFVPTPIGYIEFFKNGLLQESYFVSEEFYYDFTIRDPLLKKDFYEREKILRAFAKFSYDLHEEGIFHDDYSPGNILIQKEKNVFEFKIVDVNRMKFGSLNSIQRAKNFSKLWASDDDLKIIGDEYIKFFQTNEDFIEMICAYSMQNKKIKNFKKKLKGKEIDW